MVNRGHRFLTDPLLRNPVFLLCFVAYLAFRFALWAVPDSVPALIRNYLPDFLCLPIVLTITILVQRHLVLQNPTYRLNNWQIGFAILYFSVLFELVFPHFYPRYTSDLFDVLAYALGGLLFGWKINPPATKSAT